MTQPDTTPPYDQDEINRIRQVYDGVYRPQSENRAYIWHPRHAISLHYRHSVEKALIDLFNEHNLDIENYTLLDVGCGTGVFIRFMIALQANPHTMFGLDLMPYRVAGARATSPESIGYIIGDATWLPYADNSFDIVSQFTVFSSVLDINVRGHIAQEMSRVVKTDGFILWYDMTTPPQGATRGLPLPEILELFSDCRVVSARKLHSRYSSRIAPRSQLLASIWDSLPGIGKTHYLALLQRKPSF